MAELKPCPFCGGEAERNDGLYRKKPPHEIECSNCHAASAFSSRATDLWNARVAVTP